MNNLIFYYLIPLVFIWSIYSSVRGLKLKKNRKVREKVKKSGMTEPASLHPVIDHTLCLGCGSCVDACPEQASHHVLGIIRGKSHLIAPADCIGHGACKTACPHSAITLVFGTKRRGIEIPMVNPSFETNIKGIFIAGELGGMGLIRNAIIQGYEALKSIINVSKHQDKSVLDVFIVGSGPAGFAASLQAMKSNLSYVTVEQDSLGGTVYQYPRGKLVMTDPVNLPTFGKVMFKEIFKEELLNFWKSVETKSGVNINYKERVEDIEKKEGIFEIKTSSNTYRSRTVLLAIGRRGTPRKLGVLGEDKPKVLYRLIEPEQYQGKHVLVVGGGDSALEAALSVAEEEGTTVTLSYRSEAFSRAKEKNRLKVEKAVHQNKIKLFMKSTVKEIADSFIQLEQEGSVMDIVNDAVIVSAGGVPPTGLLRKIGINVETKYGTP